MALGGAAFLTAGAALVFFGVLASLVFERFRVPDVVLLLVLGILLGPVTGIVDPSGFGGIAQVFTTLALVVILFEGGLDLSIEHLRSRLGLTTVLLVTSYFATALGVMAVAVPLAGMTPPVALLFGLVVAPLASSIVIPLVSRLRVLPETKAVLTVESALGDVLAVVVVTLYAGVLGGEALQGEAVARTLVTSLLVGVLLALGAGLAWLFFLRFLRGRPYAYLVTFAVALLVFGLVDAAGGSGVVAVLVFALVLGNAGLLSRYVQGIDVYTLDDRIRWFHAEMSFFVRTFFFVYLGLVVTPGALGGGLLVTGLGILAATLVVRGLVVFALVKHRPAERQDAGYLVFLTGRGLASAALATVAPVVAVSAGTDFQDLVFAVVLLSNVAMSAFVLAKERGPGAGADVEAHFHLTDLDLEGLSAMPTNEADG